MPVYLKGSLFCSGVPLLRCHVVFIVVRARPKPAAPLYPLPRVHFQKPGNELKGALRLGFLNPRAIDGDEKGDETVSHGYI